MLSRFAAESNAVPPDSWAGRLLRTQSKLGPVLLVLLGAGILLVSLFFWQPFETYEIDIKTNDALLGSGVPSELVQGLEPIRGQKFTGRAEFESLLKGTLDEKDFSSYRTVLLSSARKGTFSRIFAVLIGLYCLMAGLVSVFLKKRRERPWSQAEALDSSERRAFEERARQEEILRRELFEANLNSVNVIERLSMRNLRFYDDLDWSVHPQMNVLLGRNGYGKSHLLRGLVSLLQWDQENTRSFFEHEGPSAEARIRVTLDDKNGVISWKDRLFEDFVGKLPVLSIPDSRFIDRSKRALGVSADAHLDPSSNGSYHFLNEVPYDSVIENLLHAMASQYVTKRRAFKVTIFELARRVIRELTDESFDFAEVESHVSRGAYTIKVITEGNEETPLPIQAASQGTLSVLAVFGLIYYFLLSVYPDTPEKKLAEKPAIVVIDELDAHLHPVWQRQVIPLLRREFPQVQFIITAHSPLVVAGCYAGEVSVMRKSVKTGRFELIMGDHDFIGWTTEEIYAEIFGIEGFDETYYNYASLGPQEQKIRSEYESLVSRKDDLKERDRERLDELDVTLRRLDQVQERQARLLDYEDLLQANQRLRRQLRQMKEGPSA